MKAYIDAFFMAMSMYTVIPVPHRWNENAIGKVTLFLPIVGGIIGGLWVACYSVLAILNVHAMLTAAVLCITLPALCGFIHMDGYMDCCDAVFSGRERSKMLLILKDPTVGVFAVCAFGVYMLLTFSACYVIVDDGNSTMHVGVLILVSVVARAIVGYILITGKALSETGFVATFKAATPPFNRWIMIAIVIVGVLTSFVLFSVEGVTIVLVSAFVSLICYHYVYSKLGGVSGDVCGLTITVGELSGLLCLAVL